MFLRVEIVVFLLLYNDVFFNIFIFSNYSRLQ